MVLLNPASVAEGIAHKVWDTCLAELRTWNFNDVLLQIGFKGEIVDDCSGALGEKLREKLRKEFATVCLSN